MESWNRKLRMGMVGGGQGAFIGGVHRIAATLDQQIEVVAGCFSRDPRKYTHHRCGVVSQSESLLQQLHRDGGS